MKKIKIVLFSVLALGLTLTSCSDDDNKGGNDTSAKLEGKWVYSREGVAGGGQEVWNDYEHAVGCNKDYLELTATTQKDVHYWGSECEEDIEISNFTRNGNIITFEDQEAGDKVEITILTSTKLQVRTTYTFDGEQITDLLEFTRG